MNALAFPVEFRGTPGDITSTMVLFADNAGLLGQHTAFIGDLRARNLDSATLLQLVRAAWPALTILWCDWAERPSDFSRATNDVLLVKVPGEAGYSQPDMFERHAKAKRKHAATKAADLRRDRRSAGTLTASAADVADRFDHEVPSLREWRHDPGLKGLAKREQAKTVVAAPVADTSVEVVAKCCGISHTRSSYAALELLGASDRTEGFTAIHEQRRACGCCGAVLVVITRRLLAEGR